MANQGSVQDFIHSAKPLMFENGDPDFPYSMQGTCFLAKVAQRAYAITAAHCLVGRTLESVRIRMHPGVLQFMRLNPLRCPIHWDGDREDLAIFEIQRDSFSPKDFLSRNFLSLEQLRFEPFVLDEASILAAAGYPSELNTITYESYSIMTQANSFDGRYCGPGEESGCSKIRINSLGSLSDMDGLSGSPVLRFTPLGESRYRPHFAGILTRGTSQSGLGRFINAPYVYAALGF
jgi:hypothetical protein